MPALNNHICPVLEYVCFLLVFSVSLVAANGGYSSCCAGASHCGGPSRCGAWAVGTWASVVAACGPQSMQAPVAVAHRLSGFAVWGIFPDQGWNPCLLHYQADFFFFLTTEPPGKLLFFAFLPAANHQCFAEFPHFPKTSGYQSFLTPFSSLISVFVSTGLFPLVPPCLGQTLTLLHKSSKQTGISHRGSAELSIASPSFHYFLGSVQLLSCV